jgi:putative restriction endonuclease
MAFGEIPGYPPGSTFEDRRELFESGVHRQTQAGISGRADEGAESIVLSGGYVDDEDHGNVIIYTGAGGNRDGRQVANQQLNRFNLALANSLRHGLPVRVIRGASPEVYDPPVSGYRYDGLYRVDDYWSQVSKRHGYRIWRFRLVKLPADGVLADRVGEQLALYDPAARRAVTVSRVVRDTTVTRAVKRLHGYRCQVCGIQLDTPPGPYAEAAHVRPLGRPHDGPDVLENVLCLCPNHHVLFDRWQLSLTDDLALIGVSGRLRTHARHILGVEHVRYHRALYEAAQAA